MTSPLQSLGFLRNLGQALQAWSGQVSVIGNKLQGKYGNIEKLMRSRRAIPVRNLNPTITKAKFIAPSVVLAGEVNVGVGSSIWYSTVVRADQGAITIGENTHIQERVVLRSGLVGDNKAIVIGNNVTIETGVLIEGPCVVEDGAYLCAGCLLLPGSQVQKDAVVGTGVVIDAGATVSSGTIVLAIAGEGNPSQARPLTEEEKQVYIKKGQVVAALALDHEHLNTSTIETVMEEKMVTAKMTEILNDPDRFSETPNYVLTPPKPLGTFLGPNQVYYPSEKETTTHTVK